MNDILTGSPEVIDLSKDVSYEVIWDQASLEVAVSFLSAASLLAVDTENTGLDVWFSKPLLLQISDRDKCYIFPAWIGLDFTPVRNLLEDRSKILIFHNAKYDLKFLSYHYNIHPISAYDTQIAERLLTVGVGKRYFSLAELLDKYLGIKLDKTVRSKFIDRDPIANPITEEEYIYAARDVLLLPPLLDLQRSLLEGHGLLHVFDLEASASPVITEMELTGVLLDQEKWRELTAIAKKKADDLEEKIIEMLSPEVKQPTLFGVPTINLRSPAQLISLFQNMGLDIESTDEGELKRVKNKHPVIELLISYRGWVKVVDTYGEAILARINKITGRLHAEFNQIHADTGRMSSSNPNLQNIPGYDEKDPDALNFRSCFIAGPGEKIIVCDYSQQELRILAELSEDPIFAKAYLEKGPDGKYLDIHTYTASVVFGIPYEKVDPKGSERKKAKVINFFLIYGGGPMALAESLGVSMDEAQEIIDKYFQRFPKIKSFLRRLAAKAVHDLCSLTVAGRKRFYFIPPISDPDHQKKRKDVERQGTNTVIQGSGADVTKLAMVIYAAKIREHKLAAQMLMVVHDEIVAKAPDNEVKLASRLLEEAMEEAWDYYFKKIRMVVDAGNSSSWQK